MSRRNQQVSEIVSARDVAEVPATVTETAPAVADAAKPKSIRQLVMGMILAGKPTKEIGEQIGIHFPGTAADRKRVKHIAWYRSRMKKDGLLTPKAPETPTVDAETAS